MKRLFDFVAAACGLLLLSPLLLLLAVAVVVDSGFPVLFRQVRVGRGGRDFRLAKFRTMTVLKEAEHGSFDAGSTRRVTTVGRFLRKSKLDELPQLWNVLVGDMSIVGPRPEVRQWVNVYPERWAQVHGVRPGITDPASIRYRNEEDLLAAAQDPEAFYRDEILPRKLVLYEAYVQHHSLVGDLAIVSRTLWVVAKGPSSSQ
jgi:lipopolysaccharide/colanic/teichoic acid biosynthesis glycosyltransferase